MKRTDLKPDEYRFYTRFGIQGMPPYARRAVNTVVPHVQNSFGHEVAKFAEAFERIKMGHKIITEAWDKELQVRRDLVDLTEGVAVEIEKDKKRVGRHAREIEYMRVII